MRSLFLHLLLLSPVCLFAGCGGVADAPTLATVSGKVVVDGKPQAGLRVEFVPNIDAGTSGPMSSGETADDGSFMLSCSTGRAGAVIGNHKVLVKCPWTLGGRKGGPITADGFGSSPDGKPIAVPPPSSGGDCTVNIKFEDLSKTPLTAVVPEEGVQDLLLQVTSK